MLIENPFIWIGFPVAMIALVLSVRYWQHGLFSVFLLVVFEGALRKWVLPSAQAQIYFVKDVILLGVYVVFLLANRRKQVLSGLSAIKIALALAFVFGCIQVLNPNSPSVLLGLIGLKAYFFYAPVAFILPFAFKSREQFLQII